MTDNRVECPGCRTVLSVPDDLGSRKIRCSVCKTVFDVSRPRRVVVPDELIVGWLKDWSPDHDDEVADEHFDPREETYIAPAMDRAQCRLRRFDPDAPTPADIDKAHAAGALRLVRLSHRWAEFAFPP